MEKQETYPQDNPGITLLGRPRDFQIDAWSGVLRARQQGRERALLRVPVGMGNLFLTATDIVHYYNGATSEGFASSPRMLYVSPGAMMHEEARHRITGLLPELTTAFTIEHPPQAGLTFSTFGALEKQLDQINPHAFDYITWNGFNAVDPAANMEVVEHFRPSFALAITSSPAPHGPSLEEYFGESVYHHQVVPGSGGFTTI